MAEARLHLIAQLSGAATVSRSELGALAEGVVEPLLEALEQTRALIAIRLDGTLWEYLEAEHESLIDRLSRLVGEGTVELVGGGFYAPILALLPARDAVGQLEMAAGCFERRTGVRPKGAWLDEGVWEPHLCEILAEGGARWTALPEAMLRTAAVDGVPRGWYVTEHAGRPLAVLPIDRAFGRLFGQGDAAAACAELLQRAQQAAPSDPRPLRLRHGATTAAWTWAGPAQLLAKDGEARGLRRLLAALDDMRSEARSAGLDPESKDSGDDDDDGARPPTLALALPRDTLERCPSSGRVYLASGIDADLLVQTIAPWRLDGFFSRRDLLVAGGDSTEGAEDWLRAGLWQAYLARYGEVDRLHKRMIEVSRRFAAAERVMRNGGFRAMSQLVQPRRALYRGQRGAVYGWGHAAGLHDADLRAAAHAALAEAEVAVDALICEPGPFLEVGLRDHYAELETAVLLRNRNLRALLRPSHGGVLAGLELVSAGAALHDTLTRRREHGHPPDAPVDGHERAWLHDRFLPAQAAPGAPPGAGWLDDSEERGDLLHARYRTLDVQTQGRGADERAVLTLCSDGRVAGVGPDGGDVAVTLVKTVAMAADADLLEARWTLDFEPAPSTQLRFAIEINASLGTGSPGPGLLRWQGGAADIRRGQRLHGLRACDLEHARARVRLRFDRAVTLEACPIETLAQPVGQPARACFQGVALLFAVDVPAGSAQVRLALQIEVAARERPTQGQGAPAASAKR